MKRISTGGMMHAVAMSAMIAAGKEMLDPGTFAFTKTMPFAPEIDPLLKAGSGD